MKTIRTAALIVGAVALVAAGVGAIAGATAFAAATGVSLTTVSAIGTVAGLVSTLTAKKPSVSVQGTPTQFRIDLNAPIPYMVGRTQHAGYIVHRDYYGSKNVYQSFVSVISGGGPIQEIEAFQVDRTTTTFSAGNAVGFYHDWMWLSTQLGATPQASAMAAPFAGFPNWTAASKLSGHAAYLWTLKYDTKGKKYTAGVPQPGVIAKGVKVYDPRLDNTYSGGAGAHRANNEATWTYSENPWLHALTWVIGRHQNGKRVLGVGVPIEQIDVAAFVDAANVADLNGWKIGGVVYSTDDKWNVLKQMAQAGGGEPIRSGALVSCAVNAPRVSLDTVTIHDLIGEGSVSGTQARRDRINGIVPRYRSEPHGWEVIPASEVRVADYVTADGGPRTKEVEYPLVQQLSQVAQLAAYDIVNAREFGPITLPLKIRWMGYKPGDCITLNLPDMNLNGQTAIVIARRLDPQTGIVTLTLRSETTAKHAFALGKTTTAPPTPSLTPPDISIVDPPEPGAWSITGTGLTAAGVTFPALIIEGAADNPNADAVIIDYRLYADGLGTDDNWIGSGTLPPETTRHEISSVTGNTEYQVSVRYRVRGVIGSRRIIGPVTTDNAAGIGGSPGADGRNVAQVMIFRRATSTPPLPSANVTFSFVTGAATGLNNGWTRGIPAGSDPLYASLATASNIALTDVITPGEWAAPEILVTDSTDGLNSATVFLWQRNNSGVAPAAPSSTLTYTFASGVLSGTLGSWSQSVPDASDGRYLFVTTASAISSSASDTIASGEWSPVERHARDGEDGASAFTLIATGSGSVGPNSVAKLVSGSAWDSGGYSREGYKGGARVSFKVPGWSFQAMGGLSTLSAATSPTSNVTYAIYARGFGEAFQIYRNGSPVYTSTITRNLTETITVINDTKTVRYFIDDIELPYSHAPNSATEALYADFAILNSGHSITDITFTGVGAPGTDGLSITELTIYRRATSAPATPTGGSYNFATKALTPPSGWSTSIPAGNDPLYAASGSASVQGITGTATPAWLGVGLLGQEGAATNVIFRRSATAPATPAASVGTPSGWYDSTGSVPAGADPIWASFGSRPNAGSNWTWQTPKVIEGSNGIDGLTFVLSPTTISVQADSSGVVKPGALPINFRLRTSRGTTNLSPTSPVAVAFSPGLSGTINNTASSADRGLGQLTGMTAPEGYIDITVTVNGVAQAPQRIAVTRKDDPPPPQSPTSLTSDSLGNNRTGTYPANPNSAIVTMQSDASGRLRAILTSQYLATGGASPRNWRYYAKFVFRAAGSGSGWTDFGPEQEGILAFRSDFENDGGWLNFSQDRTTLSANTNYEVGLLWRGVGTATSPTPTGTIVVRQP